MPRCGWSCWPGAECEECTERWRREEAEEKERANARIESLERQLAAAEEDLRRLMESREKQRGAQTAATLLLTKPSGIDVDESPSRVKSELNSSSGVKSADILTAPTGCQISVIGTGIVSAEATHVAVPDTGVEAKLQHLPADRQTCTVGAQAGGQVLEKTSQVDAGDGARDIKQQELDDMSCSPSMGAQCGLLLPYDVETAQLIAGSTTGVATTPPLAETGPRDERESQRAGRGDHVAGNSDSGGATAMSQELSGASDDMGYVSQGERSKETPRQLEVCGNSQHHREEAVYDEQLEVQASTAKEPYEPTLTCIKESSAYQSVSAGTACARRARTASKGPAEKKRRRRCCTHRARSGSTAHGEAFGLVRGARTFDPGGH